MKLFRNERGFALPLALLVMVTTSAIIVTAITTTSSTGRTANLGKAAVGAEALAEAGINNAMAVLANPSNYAFNPQLLPSRTTTYNEGTVTWSGTLDPNTAYWTITSVGSVQNPTSTGFLTRRLTATSQVVPTLSSPLNTLAWNYIYARQTGNTCDMTIGQTVQISSPLFVNGNLCLQNSAKVTKGPLVVGGSLTQTNNNSVGTGSTPINSVVVGGTCSKGGTTQNPCLGTPPVNIFATTFTRTLPSIPAPTVDWNGWYLVANPGPYYPCATSSGTPPVFDTGQGSPPGSAVYRNNSLNSGTPFNLTPASSYTCTTVAGELSWNAATKVLTIKGTVFIDGSATIQNGSINSYSGFGTIYLSGTLLVKNSSMCAVKTANGSTCTASGWISDSAMLVFVVNGNGGMGGVASQVGVANGVELVSAYLQGAVYATSAIDISTTSQVDGPLDGSTVLLGQSTQSSWPVFTIVPAGMPGNPVAYANPQRPSYSG
jgi:Tfp pilus assembly protein PilX